MWNARDWEFCKDPAHAAGPMWMDDCHVEAIYHLCMKIGFRRMMEIGCWDGFSTSALVQAKIDAACGRLICVDVEARPTLFQVLRKSRDNWSFERRTGAEVLALEPAGDLLVIDSDHDLVPSQQELTAALKAWWTTIIAHDVGATQTHSPGPQWILAELTRRDWFVAVDEAARDGLATHRGLMIASQQKGVYDAAVEIFAKLPGGHLS